MEADIHPVPARWAPNFFSMWTGQAFSLVGSSLVQFALVWYLTKTTGSATVLATSTLAGMLPQIVLGPFVGTLIDRWNRKAVMIVADSLIAMATLVLIYLFAVGRESVLAVYLILLFRSAGGAFHYPSVQASTSLMVPKEHLARIAGLNQTLNGVINIVSPPLGALLIGLWPMHNVLMIDVGTAAVAVGILIFVAVPHPPRQVAQAQGTVEKTSYWQDLRAGWRYILSWPGLLGLLILALIINFMLTPAGALIPIVVTKVYHGGVAQLGLVDSLFGGGVIVGGLALSIWGGFKKRIVTTMLGIFGIGAGILIFGLMPVRWYALGFAGAFLAGAMQVLANGPLSAIFQSAVDPDMQGRVMSLINAGATAMSPLSLLVAGPVADLLGVRSWFLIGGIACIGMAIAGFLIPAVMNIEQNAKKTESPGMNPVE